MSEKKKWPLEKAIEVAETIRAALYPLCDRIEVVGSVRRRKPMVGDIEINYIPRTVSGPDRRTLFGEMFESDLVGEQLDTWLRELFIEKRRNVDGHEMWGASNKLARHAASGIPVDFFATTEAAWWNYLVCRTGGAISNTRIASVARSRGWKWCPTCEGFMRFGGPDHGRMVRMESERAVFAFVKIPYREPHERA